MPTPSSTGLVEFGDALLRTGDLDPVYAAVFVSGLPPDTLARLCVGYWCFYHLGVAAQLAETSEARYWRAFERAAENRPTAPGVPLPYPRGSERRHFRGAIARRAASDLTSRYRTPTAALEGLLGVAPFEGRATTFDAVSRSVRRHSGFGPWIAFKIADMAERLLGVDVDFEGCDLGIYRDPRQGAAVAWYVTPELNPAARSMTVASPAPWALPIADAELRKTVAYYVRHWRKTKAPPSKDRPVNVQEVETIFCKYKSHLKGHYHVGKDLHDIRLACEGRGDLAFKLQQGLPK